MKTWPLIQTILTLLLLLAILGYAFYRSFQKSEDPQRLLVRWGMTILVLAPAFFLVPGSGPFMPLMVLPFAIATGLIWTPSWGEMLARPLTGLFDGGDVQVEPAPVYSMAEAQRNRGHYAEAAAEVQKQLERFPHDYSGQMLLARIQAEHLQDLPLARATIERMLSQPGHSAPNISDALLQLAEWHLKLAQDFDLAREALERIVALLPATQFAHNAAQRLAHLRSTANWSDPHDRQPIALRRGTAPEANPEVLDKTPQTLAAEYVAHLGEHPLDTEVRERLALLYAEFYQRTDLALGEIEQLIALPNQTTKDVVRWLNLLADIQLRFGNDIPGATATLHRIISLFPETASADKAKTRLAYLKLELKGKEVSRSVALGTYEGDLGLKPSKTERDAENAAKPFRRLTDRSL